MVVATRFTRVLRTTMTKVTKVARVVEDRPVRDTVAVEHLARDLDMVARVAAASARSPTMQAGKADKEEAKVAHSTAREVW